MDYNTNQKLDFCSTTSSGMISNGDAMKHLQPVLAITASPYPY
jgi:hypothetical protein